MLPLNPAVRLWRLTVYRYPVIFLGATLCATLTVILGLMTPKTYLSEAVIGVESVRTGVDKIISPLMGDIDGADLALNKAVTLLHSSKVMETVAEQLYGNHFDLALAFPLVYESMDWRRRIGLMGLRLDAASIIKYKPRQPLNLTVEEILAQIEAHLAVVTDRSARTVTLRYKAGRPEFAQLILQLITENFMRESTMRDRQEFANIEAYLSATLRRIDGQIHDVEGQIYSIMEKFPEMSSAAGGKDLFASDYLKRRDALNAVEHELGANNRLLNQWQAIPRQQLATQVINQDVKAKVLDEIAELEFKRIEATQVMGYPSSHESLRAGDQRLAALKTLLKKIDEQTSASAANDAVLLAGKDAKNLPEKASELLIRDRQLEVEKTLLKGDLEVKGRFLKTGIRKEFELESLNRQLAAYTKLSGDLAIDLEKVRMQMAGAKASVSIQKIANLPGISNSLSLQSRAAFGFVVGIAFVLSILLLLDLARPRLFAANDFAALTINLLGRFRMDSSDANSAAARIIAALAYDERRDSKTAATPAPVVVFYPVSLPNAAAGWLTDISAALAKHGIRAATIAIGTSVVDASSSAPGHAYTKSIAREDVPFTFASSVADLAGCHDLILVYAADLIGTPLALPLNRLADHVVYLSSLGRSEYSTVMAIKNCVHLRKNVGHHGMVIAV